MISHNEVNTHYYRSATIHKETHAMAFSFQFTSAQMIVEEEDSKQ